MLEILKEIPLPNLHLLESRDKGSKGQTSDGEDTGGEDEVDTAADDDLEEEHSSFLESSSSQSSRSSFSGYTSSRTGAWTDDERDEIEGGATSLSSNRAKTSHSVVVRNPRRHNPRRSRSSPPRSRSPKKQTVSTPSREQTTTMLSPKVSTTSLHEEVVQWHFKPVEHARDLQVSLPPAPSSLVALTSESVLAAGADAALRKVLQRRLNKSQHFLLLINPP